MVEEVGESQGVASPDWDAVREDYADRNVLMSAIYEKYGITPRQLYERRRLGGWPTRYNVTASGRARLISRMYALLDRQLQELERSDNVAGEKEVTLLANLARTLDKLADLDVKRPKQKVSRKTADPEVTRMREALAARLSSLDQD